jgi:hypothetical protein
MMNNQVEQMVSLQNKLYELLISKEEQVCGVNTRGGSATQDPDFPEGHPKRKEQDALKANKSSARISPNGNKFKERDKDQEQDTSISDAKIEDGNNNRKNHRKLMKNNKTMSIMKNMNLMQEMILNLQRGRMKERNTNQKEVNKEILRWRDQYHILKR